MIRFHAARAWALAAAVAVAPSACGARDEPSATPSTTAATTTMTSATGLSSSTTLPATTTTEVLRLIEVTYAGGQVAGGVQRASAKVGERVRIRVTSDVADEVHVHTYDRKAPVAPGQPAELDFVASIPGRHEVELEKKHKQLLVLEVK